MSSPKRPIYNPEISLGHLLTIAGMLGAGISIYAQAAATRKSLEDSVVTNTKKIEVHDNTLRSMVETQVKIVTIQEVQQKAIDRLEQRKQ